MEPQRFQIRPARPEDADSGSVWLTLDPTLPHRTVIKMTRSSNGKAASIYCEGLAIGAYFVERYNSMQGQQFPELFLKLDFDGRQRALPDSDGKGLMFMSEYYREKLGVEDFDVYDLEIARVRGFRGAVLATLSHPQLVIRYSVSLAILGAALGGIGVLLGALSIVLAVIPHK
jgi:hypothetical protein